MGGSSEWTTPSIHRLGTAVHDAMDGPNGMFQDASFGKDGAILSL